MKPLQITDFIPTGRNNAISMKDLATLLNISERGVRSIIQRAREQGAPICSEYENRGGYYLPADKYEALSFLRQQKARIRSARSALNGIVTYLQSFVDPDDIDLS
ncbi:MAG: HTH domain-containing protein [Oscillospiraceae bacterium]